VAQISRQEVRFTFAVLIILIGLTACDARVTFFEAQNYPKQLSDWGVLFVQRQHLQFGARVLPYDLNTPLFSDYARKHRTVWMPDQSGAKVASDGTFSFPVGTIISKTFYYPESADGMLLLAEPLVIDPEAVLDLGQVRLIETRLLVKQAHGWDALPYLWNESETEATLKIDGAVIALSTISADADEVSSINYVMPTRNECASCHASDHTSGKLLPIGLKNRHLNKDYRYAAGTESQLRRWREFGYLEQTQKPMQANALWDPEGRDNLVHRARSYLDINCGHCHNPRGAADTSGLFLDYSESDPTHLGICKPPIAAGRGSGGFYFSIVPGSAETSILSHRMKSIDPAVMMPELGRTVPHKAGVELIETWIDQMAGDCKPAAAGMPKIGLEVRISKISSQLLSD